MRLKELGQFDDEEWEEGQEGDSVKEGNHHESEADKVEKGSEEGSEYEGEYDSDGESDEQIVPEEEGDAGLSMPNGLDESRYLEAPEFIILYVGYSFKPHQRCKEHTSRTTPDIRDLRPPPPLRPPPRPFVS